MDTVVLYHADCHDGFAGALVAWKKFGDSAKYIPVQYDQPTPEGLAGKHVYLIDFCYPLEVMRELEKNGNKIVVIDHHKSAEPVARQFSNHFSIEFSGAVLAWKYFFPQDPEIPMFLRYIQDADMFEYKMPYIHEFRVLMQLEQRSLIVWNQIFWFFGDQWNREEYLADGKILVSFQKKTVDSLVDLAEEVEFAGYRVRAVNLPWTGISRTDVGAVLATKYPPFGIIWRYSKGRIYVSLRGDGSVDLSEIAKRMSPGGGGHHNAAAFSIEANLGLPFKFI